MWRNVVADELQTYLTAGYVFGISDNIRFKPAVLVNYVNGSPLRYNLSANFLFYDKLTVGASYQVDAAVSALAGFQISDNFFRLFL
ncbi:type IX secretion system membrane protein PorP/SprF [Dokdonia sp. Dokd-P16]|uniref:type IX secretion system membrane protein PorP/SprF n=1 Tax=Dokdonia sp. Dokd-P16 TaxID=2173169 RepID=UPI001EF348FA|nr:type IX secretion system membrane protein PorP/SprF [Dokdonia sp. Dokd-P16]